MELSFQQGQKSHPESRKDEIHPVAGIMRNPSEHGFVGGFKPPNDPILTRKTVRRQWYLAPEIPAVLATPPRRPWV